MPPRPALRWGSFEHRIYRDLIFGLKLTRKKGAAISYARERRPHLPRYFIRRIYDRHVRPQLAATGGRIDPIS